MQKESNPKEPFIQGTIKETVNGNLMGIVISDSGEELYFERSLYYNIESVPPMKIGDRVSFKARLVHKTILRPFEFYKI
jgi:hypothetical protein